MPMHAACKIRVLITLTLAVGLCGCAARAPISERSATGQVVHAVPAEPGQAYRVVDSDSLLIVRVYRGGTRVRAGHNHIVASHDLAGTVYVAKDLPRSSFELEVPVAELTVDEAELRAAQGADFAADVPDSAKEGTRRNMLGAAVLDAEHYPRITVRSENIDVAGNEITTRVEVRIRDQVRSISVPVSFTVSSTELLAEGALALKQTDLGLAPFTALLGALAVQDEMQLHFRVVARVQK